MYDKLNNFDFKCIFDYTIDSTNQVFNNDVSMLSNDITLKSFYYNFIYFKNNKLHYTIPKKHILFYLNNEELSDDLINYARKCVHRASCFEHNMVVDEYIVFLKLFFYNF